MALLYFSHMSLLFSALDRRSSRRRISRRESWCGRCSLWPVESPHRESSRKNPSLKRWRTATSSLSMTSSPPDCTESRFKQVTVSKTDAVELKPRWDVQQWWKPIQIQAFIFDLFILTMLSILIYIQIVFIIVMAKLHHFNVTWSYKNLSTGSNNSFYIYSLLFLHWITFSQTYNWSFFRNWDLYII